MQCACMSPIHIFHGLMPFCNALATQRHAAADPLRVLSLGLNRRVFAYHTFTLLDRLVRSRRRRWPTCSDEAPRFERRSVRGLTGIVLGQALFVVMPT